jgi:hypothetical protein
MAGTRLDERPRPSAARRSPLVPLEQLEFEFARVEPRWAFSRVAARSPHLKRIRSRLDYVRRHFPELHSVCIRVGLARKRGVLGWGSLDPHHPGIWIRPRRLDYFTIAHELTHLLQARGQVPRGERACDLHALARSPELVDTVPSYLRLPLALCRKGLRPGDALMLHRAACRALEARAAGDRQYLRLFERTVATAMGMELVTRARRRR